MANAQRKPKPSVLSNLTLTQRREQARTSPFPHTCAGKERVMGFTGKEPQHVNAYFVLKSETKKL